MADPNVTLGSPITVLLTRRGLPPAAGKPDSKYYEYEEAWHLLKPPEKDLSDEGTSTTNPIAVKWHELERFPEKP
jgi:hypothetical protein